MIYTIPTAAKALGISRQHAARLRAKAGVGQQVGNIWVLDEFDLFRLKPHLRDARETDSADLCALCGTDQPHDGPGKDGHLWFRPAPISVQDGPVGAFGSSEAVWTATSHT